MKYPIPTMRKFIISKAEYRQWKREKRAWKTKLAINVLVVLGAYLYAAILSGMGHVMGAFLVGIFLIPFIQILLIAIYKWPSKPND